MASEMISRKDFFIKWSLLSFGIIPLTYLVSLIVVLLVHGAFGFDQTEGGTFLSQTVMQIAGGSVIGLGTGLYQRAMLKKVFRVSVSWIYSLIAGFAVTELIAGIILGLLGINRYELRFIESDPVPEALLFACAGLITGILQWIILRRFYSESAFWIIASTFGWWVCVFATLFSVWAFLPGALLYGAITGATFVWF